MPINNSRTNEHETQSCQLLVNNFFAYYTHNNIYYGKPAKEFCDALVVFEDYNLVFQMKRIENSNIDNYNKQFEHGISQLKGCERIIENNLALQFGQGKNSSPFNISLGKKTFYILLMDGMWEYLDPALSEDKYRILMTDGKYKYLREETHYSDFIDESRINNDFFVFNDFRQIEKTLKHCSTIKDFIHYLEFKRYLMQSKAKLMALHDEAILSHFILGGRSVLKDLDDKTFLIFGDELNLNSDEVKERLRQEEVSHRVIDKNLIQPFLNKRSDENIEVATREIVALTRQQRLCLTNNCLTIQESQRFLAMFYPDDRETMYCISDYSDKRRNVYQNKFKTVEEYIINILYPIACYQISKIGKSFDKTVFILYGIAKDNLKERTLAMIEGEATPHDIECGKVLEEGLQLKINQWQR